MCQKIELEQSKVDTILPDQLRQFVFGILWDVAKEVDCSLGLCGSERVGTGKLGDIIVGLAAQSHDQAQQHWIIIFGHMLATLQAQRKKTTIYCLVWPPGQQCHVLWRDHCGTRTPTGTLG